MRKFSAYCALRSMHPRVRRREGVADIDSAPSIGVLGHLPRSRSQRETHREQHRRGQRGPEAGDARRPARTVEELAEHDTADNTAQKMAGQIDAAGRSTMKIDGAVGWIARATGPAPAAQDIAHDDRLDEWLELREQRGDQFGDGRVNVHRARDDRVGGARVHDIEHAVDRFVGFDP